MEIIKCLKIKKIFYYDKNLYLSLKYKCEIIIKYTVIMITCMLYGGLGNQMFQIFATMSYAINSKNKFMFNNIYMLGQGTDTVRHTFWNSFFINLKPFLSNEDTNSFHEIREQGFTYNEFPDYETIGNNCLLNGYFQSYKYFDKNYETISKIIDIKTKQDTVVKKSGLKNEYLKNCVSIHFRIGDYKNKQEYHPLTTYNYYKNSLHFIKNKSSQKYNIIYFCEDVDINDITETIVKLQKDFPEYNFIRGLNTLEDWEQLLLMSCCHHNVIANSTFSWWAAYFNNWSDKIICYPSVWFGINYNSYNTKDLCPQEWNKIQV